MTSGARMLLQYCDVGVTTSWEKAPRERGRPARMLPLADATAPAFGLACEGMCCRRLRGSALTRRNPWAYAHGYLLPRLRRSTRTPGWRPGMIFHLM